MNGPSSRRSEPEARARELYGSIVAQSRDVALYRDVGVPDTIEGRLEALMLHVAIAMGRLGDSTPQGQEQSRLLVERFVEDVDDNLREIGIADLKVPAKVKQAAAALYERQTHYQTALAGAPGMLEEALARHFGSLAGGDAVDITRLAAHVRALAAAPAPHPSRTS
ncbi:MAG: ubiquinol-cytochrome C chaperone [Hyphomicrobiales bacterium]|nr:ubiquinol-cytochrome C chaperone [Hyphomicrobiales bacterium]